MSAGAFYFFDKCPKTMLGANKNNCFQWFSQPVVDFTRDPHGYANEIFRPEVAVQDLKVAILRLMNKIKEDQVYPKALEVCDITSFWKRKASRNDYDNFRGIFRVSIFRSILDRLIYNDKYTTIDSNLKHQRQQICC